LPKIFKVKSAANELTAVKGTQSASAINI